MLDDGKLYFGCGTFKNVFSQLTKNSHVEVLALNGNEFMRYDGTVKIGTELGGPDDLHYMGNAAVFPHLYVWSGIWQNMGWSSIIYLAALSGVDQELHEAAMVDGASKLKRIIHIDLPAIIPTMVILLIMNAGSIMSVGYEKVYLMQNDLNVTTAEVISTYVYKIGLKQQQYSYSAAIGLFNNLINFILLVVVNKLSKKLSGSSLW